VTGVPTEEERRDLKDQMERLARALEENRIAEYVSLQQNAGRLIYLNFLAGVARGLGMAVGFTLVGALVIYILRQMVSIPVIGTFIAQIVDIVTTQLGRQ
jgi:3-methyladenine DNA glycosylase/8-oxoguanine DNA glycosylase